MILVLKGIQQTENIIGENNLFIFETKSMPFTYLDADSSQSMTHMIRYEYVFAENEV